MKRLLCFLLLLIPLGNVPLSAKSRKIQFRTLCLEQVEGFEKLALPAGRKLKENQEVILYLDLSPVFTASFAEDEVTFYAIKESAGEKPRRVAAGTVSLGKSDRQVFLFYPGGGNEGDPPYHIIAFEDDLKAFPLGSVRAINLTNSPVRFMMDGDEPLSVEPDGSAVFPASKKVDDYNLYPVTIEFQDAGGQWVKNRTMDWKADARRRAIVIAQGDATERTILSFSDTPTWVSR